jgi:integrase
LRAIVNYAMANDMLGRSPCRRIKLPEVTPVKRHIVSADELAGLAEAMGGVCAYGPMVYLGTVAGLRWGEVARLRVGQLDFEARTLAVTQTVVRGRGSAVAFGEPKSAAGRRTLAWTSRRPRRGCHSNPRLTLGLYAQATEAADRAAADRLGTWFLGAPERPDDEDRGMDAG